MQVQKITRAQPLGIQAYNTLKAAIVSGRMQPGDRLTEVTAAKFLGVSRTPAREALKLLSREGILDRLQQGGYAVPIPSLRKITKITEVRLLLEPYAARLVAARVTDDELTELRAAIDAEWAVLEDMTLGVFLEAGSTVRNYIYSLSDNAQLIDCIARYSDHLHFIGTKTLGDTAIRRIAVSGHDRIYEALVNRDPDAAEQAAITQINLALEAAEKALSEGE